MIDINKGKYMKQKLGYKKLFEAFEERKFEKGQVKFKTSTFQDPHIQKVVKVIAKHTNESEQFIMDKIQKSIDNLDKFAAKAPLLYETMKLNKVESSMFKLVEMISEGKPIEGAPEFDKTIFWELVRFIKAEHDQFLPLRGLADPKRLYQPVIKILDPEEIKAQMEKDRKSGKTGKESTMSKIGEYSQIGTAAASPKGEFYFNKDFMQTLLNYAHIVELKPNGKKYVSNGGKIPDEYGWVEFVIIHEFFHYAASDFHYQNIIPKANPTIINWVGDFRTNYLLVKSGYSQLPIGLFSDNINYDRQVSYQQMYNIVAEEMKKLSPEDAAEMEAEMDDQTDDHKPGQEEGASEPEDADEDGPDGPEPEKPEGEPGPYYVEDDLGRLTINGRDMMAPPTPNQTIYGNIKLGKKERFTEVEVGPGKEALVVEKKDYRIDSNGNIVVRVKKVGVK